MDYNLHSSQTTSQSGSQPSPRQSNPSSNPPAGAPTRNTRPTRVRKPSTKARENAAWAQELQMKRRRSVKHKPLRTGHGISCAARPNADAPNKAAPPSPNRASQNKFIDPEDGDILFPDVKVLCCMIGDELDEFFLAFSEIGAFNSR
ncbi:hypothetical protein AUP68_05454 [Ilyonectria robusta]